MNFAKPESTAESLARIGGAIGAGIGALTLWGLYSSTNPSNWLSNIGMSIGNNDFPTLSLLVAVGLVSGSTNSEPPVVQASCVAVTTISAKNNG